MQFQENWETCKTEGGEKALLSILIDLKIKCIPTTFQQVLLYLKIQFRIKAKKSQLASFRVQIVREPTQKQTWKIYTQIFVMAYRYCPRNPTLNSQNPVINASKNALRLMKQKLKEMYDCLKPQETIKPDGTINWKGVPLVQPRNTNSI